jgi:hypothetical protein
MSRVARVALVLGLLGACPFAAAEDAPAPPVADEVWQARDLEARWVLFRAAPDADAGGFASRWVAFFAQHEEWDLLEWTALSTTGSQPIEVLEKARRPTWMRVAVWSLQSGDSHKRGMAEARLKANAPLVRSWFALHPRAATGKAAELAKTLAAEGDARDDAGAAALVGPYAPSVLLAGLMPPPEVVPFGERLSAEPGVTYVHQVERALAMLVESGLKGESWVGLHAQLVTHPVREVRRAAAIAAAARPPAEVPEAALIGRLHAADEHADVRSAALIALSGLPDPFLRVLLFEIGSTPAHPSFTAAVSRLADVDDGFALELWKDLDASGAGPSGQALLNAERKRLAERLAAHDAESLARAVRRMLYLAAAVDLAGHPLKSRFVPWTLRAVTSAAAAREVRAALATAAQEATASGFTKEPVEAARADRMAEYAREILAKTRERVRSR